MPERETTVWGIHAGVGGEADDLFLRKSCIAIGWEKVGDLSAISPDREALKAKVAEAYPDRKPGAIPLDAGLLYRFLYEMKAGDIVVYPSKRDRQVHIGRVEGPYRYDPKQNSQYPNQRAVKWLRALPRMHFAQGALYEIGAQMTLWQVRNYADQFLAAVEGKTPPPATEDETVALVAEEIEEITRDFVLKQLAKELKGHPLADFVAHLLGAMGYRTKVSPAGPDKGVDIVAHKDELGFEPPIVKVQIKSTTGSVGDPEVSALYGKVASEEFGLLVTLGTFTTQAVNFASGKSNLRLIDAVELVDLILRHYDQFDSRYKGLIPLKRVYVPEALEEAEG